MASESFPNPGHNSGAVTTVEYEQLTHPVGGDGVVGTPSDTAVVYADSSGLQVKIRAGKRAIVRGVAWHSGTSDITVPISSNSSGSTRTDLVVLRLTRATGQVAEAVVAGTPGAGAPSPTMDTGTTGVWELPLTQVTVANGASSISSGNLTRRSWYLGPQPIVTTPNLWPSLAQEQAGQLMWDTQDAIAYISTGGGWLPLYEDTGPLNLTPAGGWGAIANQYRRLNQVVFLNLAFTRSGGTLAAGADSPLATLPAGFRPAAEMRVPAQIWISGTSVTPALVRIATSGAITLIEYTTTVATNKSLYLPPISFAVL